MYMYSNYKGVDLILKFSCMYIKYSHPSHTYFPFSIPLPPSDPFPFLSSTPSTSKSLFFLSLNTIYEEEKKTCSICFSEYGLFYLM